MLLKFIKSQKGKKMLVYNGFLYSKHEEYENKIVWRCSDYKKFACKSRSHTTSEEESGGPSKTVTDITIPSSYSENNIQSPNTSIFETILQTNGNLTKRSRPSRKVTEKTISSLYSANSIQSPIISTVETLSQRNGNLKKRGRPSKKVTEKTITSSYSVNNLQTPTSSTFETLSQINGNLSRSGNINGVADQDLIFGPGQAKENNFGQFTRTCNSCSVNIRTALSMTCDDCNLTWHARCLRLSKDDVDFLKELDTIWRCQKCSIIQRASLLENYINSLGINNHLSNQFKKSYYKYQRSIRK
ncbi:uncharacterized protein LOC112592160 [Melanaphis sacchari]|uniref:uncharacterized protein LOC112592160 n=1 Tax=Melanaphis sacchari TaxID=742174 RepID=UPI000DC14380|nr:uncharacterized protein LOC112592160 [Melanaphis sacchari]